MPSIAKTHNYEKVRIKIIILSFFLAILDSGCSSVNNSKATFVENMNEQRNHELLNRASNSKIYITFPSSNINRVEKKILDKILETNGYLIDDTPKHSIQYKEKDSSHSGLRLYYSRKCIIDKISGSDDNDNDNDDNEDINYDIVDEPFSAYSKKRRAECMITGLMQDDIDAVWAIRGGYGAAKIIDLLFSDQPNQTILRYNKDKINPKSSDRLMQINNDKIYKIKKVCKKFKWIIGYSDTTALHLAFNQLCNWPTIHGTTLHNSFLEPARKKNIKNTLKIFDILNGDASTISIDDLKPLNMSAFKIFHKSTSIANISRDKNRKSSRDIIYGKAIGGNLTLVERSIGTIWEMNGAKKIVILEDCNLAPWRLDSILLHLIQSGILTDARAIILGDFDDGKKNSLMKLVIARFAKTMDTVDIPVFKSSSFGHSYDNMPIILNSNAEIHPIYKDYNNRNVTHTKISTNIKEKNAQKKYEQNAKLIISVPKIKYRKH